VASSNTDDNISIECTSYIKNISIKLNAHCKIISLSLSSLLLTCLIAYNFIFPSCAFASSPVAVLRSAFNQQEYQEQSVGEFDEDWVNLTHTLGAANVSYEEISDGEVTLGQPRLGGYKVIVVPLLVDLPLTVVGALDQYQKSGGRILITEAGGIPGKGAKRLEQMAGVNSLRNINTTEKRKIDWPNAPQKIITDEFPVGCDLSDFSPTADASILAHWQDLNGRNIGPAISRLGNCLFISWSPALQGQISTNASLISAALENLSPGVAQQAAVQISFAEYEGIRQELEYLLKRTDEAIRTAKQADLTVAFKLIQERYDSAVKNSALFDEAYRDRRFFEADQYLQEARQDYALAFAMAMPTRPVEARNIWLDRGTIINARNPKGMAKLFDRLKTAGFNVVYFETNNAGFTMFPSTVGVQNPDTIGWDPLDVAVKEAHKRGIEIHAWLWSFNVGNAKHNPIVGKPPDYPGPVLSKYDFAWALQSADGSLTPPRQHEFWLDPSCPEAKTYIKSLIKEIITKYPLDGVQLDYIRYPFNGKNSEMGFDWAGRTRFEAATGMNLDRLDDETRQIWQAWKIQQVSNLVQEVSTMIREMKPNMRISAAVYALPKRWRLSAIQQEWEVWVNNGWVDTLNPMTYVTTANELSIGASYVRESTSDQALVYPGLSIRQLDNAALIEQLDTARAVGTLGTTLFAAAQLDDKKLNILKSGPYRKEPILTPQADPLRASRILIDDFVGLVNRYVHAPQKHILSDQASTNQVLSQIERIQKNVHQLPANPTVDQLEALRKDIGDLHETIKNWLRLEAFIQRGYRAQYIVNYLTQVESILSYAAHKAKCTGSIPSLSSRHALWTSLASK